MNIYRLVELEKPYLCLKVAESSEKRLACRELKDWADANGWLLKLTEGGDGNCVIEELVPKKNSSLPRPTLR